MPRTFTYIRAPPASWVQSDKRGGRHSIEEGFGVPDRRIDDANVNDKAPPHPLCVQRRRLVFVVLLHTFTLYPGSTSARHVSRQRTPTSRPERNTSKCLYCRSRREPPSDPGLQRYGIGPIISNAAFHYALENSPYSRDPKYVDMILFPSDALLSGLHRYIQAVMRSYIEVKEARGRSKQEIAWKLEILEREVRNPSRIIFTSHQLDV